MNYQVLNIRTIILKNYIMSVIVHIRVLYSLTQTLTQSLIRYVVHESIVSYVYMHIIHYIIAPKLLYYYIGKHFNHSVNCYKVRNIYLLILAL